MIYGFYYWFATGLGENRLLVCIDKFSNFYHLAPIFLGEGELSTKEVAFILFD